MSLTRIGLYLDDCIIQKVRQIAIQEANDLCLVRGEQKSEKKDPFVPTLVVGAYSSKGSFLRLFFLMTMCAPGYFVDTDNYSTCRWQSNIFIARI